MKLAIIGSSPLALEAAVRFHNHGAALTWFNFKEEEPEALFTSAPSDWSELTSEEGRGLLARSGKALPTGTWTWETWKKNYSEPLALLLKEDQEIKPHPVVWMGKRFLGKGEEIPGKSRFYDLFRVIYQLNPQEFIEEQKEKDPEVYKRLSQEMLSSLQSSIEMYEDFDLILDLRRPTQSLSLSHSGRSLSEKRVSPAKISYGLKALERAKNIAPSPEVRELALIGSGELAAEVLLALRPWLKDPRSRLFVVSIEDSPFDKIVEGNSYQAEGLRKLFLELEVEFEGEVSEFHQKLRDWQALDDFVQVKIPRPAEPIPRLNFFSGHNVTAVDELIDRRRLFLTLEMPDFRVGKKHPENTKLELKTLGVDEILVATGLIQPPLGEDLNLHEVGHFTLVPSLPSLRDGWKRDLEKLKGIEDEIFKLFSPSNPH